MTLSLSELIMLSHISFNNHYKNQLIMGASKSKSPEVVSAVPTLETIQKVKAQSRFYKKDFDCGCLAVPKGEDNAETVPLPLKKIAYDILIVNAVAEVTLRQTYVNTTDKFLELQYRFPIQPNGCIHKFVAVFSKLRMEGVVKEKEEARMEYTEAVKAGKRAALGQVDAESKDVMILQMGNLGPGEEVSVEITYAEELSLSLNTFYQFTLVTRHTPRYINSIPPQNYLNAFRNTVKTVAGEFEWDFRLTLRSSKKITAFRSPTHSLNAQKLKDQNTEYAFTLSGGEPFTKAFSFLYSTQEFELPSYTLGRTDIGSSVMVSFIPKFCSLDLKDAELAALGTEGFETDMDQVKGEYIFVLDRSGSMSGSPIEKAKEALILFLKSLPVDTYFQVVSFGSGSSKMFWSSQKNSNQSIADALKKIAPIEADMGGTEIYEPLKKILGEKVIEGYPKQIFLLTDGGVSNTEGVIELVRTNTRHSRVHTIGIGSGVSEALIKGCAEKGKGKHIFISELEDPSEKIIQLLNDSLTPVISKVSLTYDKDLVESIVPNPAHLPFILKGEPANFFVTFKGQLSKPTTLSLSYTDSRNNLPFKAAVEISPNTPSESFVDKLGNFKRIRALEEAEASGVAAEEFVYFAKNVDTKKLIVDISTKHQILSKHTAFVCVQKELVDGRYQEIADKGKEKVQVVTVEQPPHRPEILYDRCSASYSAPPAASFNLASIQKCMAPPSYSPSSNVVMSKGIERQMECCLDEQGDVEQCLKQCTEIKYQIKNIKNQVMQQNMLLDIQQCAVPHKKSLSKSDQQVKEVVKLQLFQGYWDNLALIERLFGATTASEVKKLSENGNRNAAITFLVAGWLQKNHPGKEYSLIIKKARSWLKKQKTSIDLPSLFQNYVK